MDGLCRKMGALVSKQAIAGYESGRMLPGSHVLTALADALSVDTEYFFRPFTFDHEQLNVSFRKKSSIGVKDIKALTVQIQDDIERYIEIEDVLCAGRSAPERLTWDCVRTPQDMECRARELRERWGLGKGCIANMQDMLETHGIRVIYTAAPDAFDGLCGVVNGTHYIIVLNSTKRHVERQRLTAAHELGHLLLNDYMPADLTARERESLCNAFANALLLPREVLEETFGGKNKIAITQLVTVAESFGISADAVVHRLHDMGIVGEKRYRSFYIRKNSNPKMRDTIEATRYKETTTDRFEAMVHSALAEGMITASKAAALLGCPVENVMCNYNVI